MMKTADGQDGRGQMPGREPMNLSLPKDITGRSTAWMHRHVGYAALSLTLITCDGDALQNMGGNGLMS